MDAGGAARHRRWRTGARRRAAGDRARARRAQLARARARRTGPGHGARRAGPQARGPGDARAPRGLARDPAAATRTVGARDWQPLLYVAYSAFLGGERTDGLLACAEALLAAGADPDAAWEDAEYDRMTALHGAAGVAHEPRLTALLLARGADPDDGRSLRFAAGAADPACLVQLLDAGATVRGAMALAHAAQRGRLRTARVLLERGPVQWGERENALQWAVRPEASPEMLQLLVKHGADVEASFDGSGRTPLRRRGALRPARPGRAPRLAGRAAPRRAAGRAARRVPGR